MPPPTSNSSTTPTRWSRPSSEQYDAGLRITVRSGGHCYENWSSGNYGGVIIDLSNMQGVSMDAAGRVRIEGGATMWNVYETLFKDYNLTIPGGSCYSVGAGGHIAGGGYGLLSRQHGLDRRLPDRSGRGLRRPARPGPAGRGPARATPETERLLWAHTGGGGGNFGIVTAYYFARLPNPPGPGAGRDHDVAVVRPRLAAASPRCCATTAASWPANSAPCRARTQGLFALIHAEPPVGQPASR